MNVCAVVVRIIERLSQAEIECILFHRIDPDAMDLGAFRVVLRVRNNFEVERCVIAFEFFARYFLFFGE